MSLKRCCRVGFGHQISSRYYFNLLSLLCAFFERGFFHLPFLSSVMMVLIFPLSFLQYFIFWAISVFTISSLRCGCLFPLWKCLIRVLFLSEIFTWEVETSHVLSGLPFLVLHLTTIGGVWTTMKGFPILAPFHSSSFSFGQSLGRYFMQKEA